jgi:hypothetical protein
MKLATSEQLQALKDKFSELKDSLTKALPPIKAPVAKPSAPSAAPAAAPAAAPTPTPAPAPTATAPAAQPAPKYRPEPIPTRAEQLKREIATKKKNAETTAVYGSGKMSTSPLATGVFKPNSQFGTTKSGKSIYHDVDHEGHSGFSADDYGDAARSFQQALAEAKANPNASDAVKDHFRNKAVEFDKKMREVKSGESHPMDTRINKR